MDCGLCMAHTSDTSNCGATIIIVVFHVSMFCVPTSSTQNPLPVLGTSAFHISTADQISGFSRTCEDLSVFYFASRKMSRKNENVLWLQKWKRRRFGRVSRTLDFSKLKSHLKSWTSPKTFPSGQKPVFQSESKCEAIDIKIVFHSHSNKCLIQIYVFF